MEYCYLVRKLFSAFLSVVVIVRCNIPVPAFCLLFYLVFSGPSSEGYNEFAFTFGAYQMLRFVEL
jgi:hypothetical protein